ncbi:MAG: hypothetical protein EOO46_00385 [Flavobacterium sp.]|nr:MAG: hypothetical protein EOO46_00385 [Flavobacterium sp.]
MGSSRVNNSVVPSVIRDVTGKSSVNLGFEASKPADILTMLKLLDAYDIKTKTVYTQIDYIYNSGSHSNILEFEMMPFIRDNGVLKNHYSYLRDDFALYYVPFYRYCQYDQKLGLREVLQNLLSKKTAVAYDNGFTPLHGKWTNWREELPTKIWKTNATINSISSYAMRHERGMQFFCAPFDPRTKNQKFVGLLRTKLPELLDYSRAVPDTGSYANYFHLNEKGAREFTAIFASAELKK